MTALWCEINKLEQRVEELETALDNSQVHIVCMEKKYEHIQLQGTFFNSRTFRLE